MRPNNEAYWQRFPGTATRGIRCFSTNRMGQITGKSTVLMSLTLNTITSLDCYMEVYLFQHLFNPFVMLQKSMLDPRLLELVSSIISVQFISYNSSSSPFPHNRTSSIPTSSVRGQLAILLLPSNLTIFPLYG